MTKRNEIPLKIELLSSGEDSQFRIRSKREIQSILSGVAKEGTRAALYYDDENDYVITSMIEANEHGMWLDVGSLISGNQRILRSKKVVFISSHRNVKVQFVSNRIESASFENRAALFMPLPDSLLRIQRREYFRLTTPVATPLKCVIPVAIPPDLSDEPDIPAFKREVTIMDISGGGVALVCEAHDTELEPGKIYEDCKINLPGIGVITTTVKVKNAFEVTLPNGHINKRAGCEFIHLSGAADNLLQLYVAQLQSGALAKT